ncbi:MAG: tetratricopeptide repeat protein [Myxococcales bacterium]|nr:tetratricopeptide repeat protein [Myxococcales bacterium]
MAGPRDTRDSRRKASPRQGEQASSSRGTGPIEPGREVSSDGEDATVSGEVVPPPLPLQDISTDPENELAPEPKTGPVLPNVPLLVDDARAEIRYDLTPGDEPADLRVRFVNRQAELKQLKQLLRHCRDQRSAVFVTLLGEPGAGKSRLAQEFARSVRAAIPEARVLAGDCGRNPQSYEPIVRVLEQRFGISDADHGQAARNKIAAGVAEVVPEQYLTEVTHLLAHLMGAPFEDSPVVEPLAAMPGQLEMRMYIAVRRFFEKDAQNGPLLMVFDRVQNARAETINLIHFLAEGLTQAPVMLVTAARPTVYRRHPRWGQGDFALHRIDVEGLPPDDALALFQALARAPELPEALELVARSRLRGSPRAIYEFVRYLLETTVLARDAEGNWRVDETRLRVMDLPRSHEEILRQRLRNLPSSERAVLEKAAVVGEVFWLDAVVALSRAATVSSKDPDGPTLEEIAASGDRIRTQVGEALVSLAQRGLVRATQPSSITGEREYRFAYAPIWDLAYELVDTQTKRYHHRLAAQWLELRPEGRAERQQEQVGHHLQRAGDGRGAASRYRRAADSARARYFNHKAIRLYKRSLSCMADADLAARIHIWHDLGSVYQLKGDFDGALDAFERMVRLGWVVASRPKAAVAFNKMGRVWRQKGNLELAREYLERGLEMFTRSGDQRGVATSLDDIGQVYWLQGRYDAALDRSATALEMRRHAGDRRSIAVSLSNIGNIEKTRGLFDEAESCYREALSLRRDIGDRYGEAATLNNIAALAFERGELDHARDEWEEALGIAETIGALPLQAITLNNLGETAAKQQRPADARQRLRKALAVTREIAQVRTTIDVLRNLGMLELSEGNHERAREYAEECLGLAREAQMQEMVGRAMHALGEVYAATLFDASSPVGGGGNSDDYFRQAIDVFRELGNEAELARALKRRGEVQLERGNLQGGREMLAEAAEIFERLGMPEGSTIYSIISGL